MDILNTREERRNATMRKKDKKEWLPVFEHSMIVEKFASRNQRKTQVSKLWITLHVIQ